VMAPAVCLSMSDQYLRVEQRGSGRNLPIDYFLQSLARGITSQAIGIILSGTASDGTLGLKAVKAEGGITFAQEPSSAKFDGMPLSAIAAGVVDFVLAPAEIAKRLAWLAQHPYMALKPEDDGEAGQETDSALNRIFRILRTATGNDFTHYKHTTIRRRINRRMVLHANEKLSDYVIYLQENPAEAKALAEDLLIRVTSFFREPEYFEALAVRVFPEILKNRTPEDPVRIWVPGCATGEEAYSIAICLTEFLERAGANALIQIFASDISASAIEKARAGIYPMPALANVSPARLKRFFVKVTGGYQIAKSIRDACIFARQNVAQDPPFNKLDLITCCNVLIYFGPVLQRKTLSMFHYALKPGGFLLLGPSEGVGPLSHSFLQLDKKLKLYSKLSGSGSLKLPFPASEPLAERAAGAMAGVDVRVAPDVQKTAERILLAQYAPAGVIVDDAMNIVHVRGETGPYLQLASGEPTFSLLRMAREGLVVGLRAAVLKARQKKTTISQQASMEHNGRLTDVTIRVIPVSGSSHTAPHFMVLFEDAASPAVPGRANGTEQQKTADDAKQAKTTSGRSTQEISRLKKELAATREYLQSIIEDQEASTEELKSANEEAQASNEELETAKEELQSSNEELNTVNDELKTRNGALTDVNNDLSNVLTSINVPLVMVGKDLNIRHFTRSMEPVLNLIDSDIGRSISDLKPNIDVPDLPELLRNVVNGANPVVREVLDPTGRWYSLQILPYRAPDNKIDGALLVMLDIDAVKHSRDFAEAIVETVRMPMVVLTKNLRIRSANQAFYETFKVAKEETENLFIYDLGNGQWNIPKLREALEKILPSRSQFQDFEVEHQFEGIGRKMMLLSACEIQQPIPYGKAILLAIEDVTGRAEAAQQIKQLTDQVAAELAGLQQVHEIGMHLVQQEDLHALLPEVVDAVIAITGADMGNIQLLDATGTLCIQAQRGFEQPFLDFFNRVHDGQAVCGTALKSGGRVVVEDVAKSPIFAGTPALDVMLAAGVRGVQATPLIGRSGRILGMFSSHYREPGRPGERVLRLLDLLARQAADLIEKAQMEEVLRNSEERFRALINAGSNAVYRMSADWSQMLHADGKKFVPDTSEPSDTWLEKYIHPDDQPLVKKVFREAIRTKSLFELEHRVRRVDGTFGWTLSRAIPLQDAKGDIVEWFGAASDVTKRREAEEALRQSEQRYRTLFDLGPVAVYSCDASGVIREFNSRAADLWGREPKPGDTDERFCGSSVLYLPDGTLVPHEECAMARVLSGLVAEVRDLEIHIGRLDGSRVAVIVNIRALKNERGEIAGAINCFVDITERQRAQKEVQLAGERFRFMAETMPQKISTATTNGAVDYLNQHWLDYTGASFEDIRDSGWTRFIHPDDLEENVRLWQHSVETGDPLQITHRLRRADGVYRWHLTRARTMPDSGANLSIWVGSSTDIHEEREQEENLRRANADLNQFAFAASHDLQEPLRMITSYSQLLVKSCRGQLDGDAEVCVGYIAEGTRRMRALLADLLSYSAASSDLSEPTRIVNLNQVFETATQNLMPAIAESGASVTRDELPSVWGHETHFVQLFQNLISNALKYRAAEAPRIHVSAENRHHEWRFSVADNGMGIAPQYHEKIFGVFKRLHGNKIPGTGIGLAICQRVAERYDGRIWVESELDQGATFYFTLPVAGADKP
jgi:PAS domain S-box-containing protein